MSNQQESLSASEDDMKTLDFGIEQFISWKTTFPDPIAEYERALEDLSSESDQLTKDVCVILRLLILKEL